MKGISHNLRHCFLLSLVLLSSCHPNKSTNAKWMEEDNVDIAIDETFKPIMEELTATFAMMHPEATMKPLFVSEDSVIRLLVNDSLRSCIATRKLNETELKVVQGHTLSAKQALIATDAIALITHKDNPDSLITLDEIKAIMTGKINKWEQLSKGTKKGDLKIVFDHSASSTVRFMKDSLCNGQPLTGPVFASDNGTNMSVIEMVKTNPDIIGIIGTDWLKKKEDEPMADFSSLDINVMRVSKYADQAQSKYVRPYQYYIATGEYPLLRSIYIITTDPRTKSMVRSFYFFAKGQKGQTIICNHSQLLPYSPVQVKSVGVK